MGVDQSVLLLKTGNDISKKDILDDLNSYDGGYTHYWRRSRNSFFGNVDVFSSNNLFAIVNGFDVNENYYRHYNVYAMEGPTTSKLRFRSTTSKLNALNLLLIH